VTPSGRDGDYDYMQMDASINPGNSGGPVLDLRGDVVAIANAVNVAGQGLGFAIPIDIAKSVLPHLHEYGHVRRGWMGISVEDCAAKSSLACKLHGVRVSEVIEGGPASRAGLRVGDVILRLDSTRVEHAHTLRWQVAARGVGQSVVLHVRRGHRPLKMQVRLEDLPGEVVQPAPAVATPSPPAAPGTGGSEAPQHASPPNGQ
jgi:serine protease Do